MAVIRSFRDPKVDQQAREQAQSIFLLTPTFPWYERLSLTDQVRRSSRAVKSMIAGAWRPRRYRAAFVSKFMDALGEATETQSWLDDALACGYISISRHQELDETWPAPGGMINNTIEHAVGFCQSASK